MQSCGTKINNFLLLHKTNKTRLGVRIHNQCFDLINLVDNSPFLAQNLVGRHIRRKVIT